MLRLSLSLFLSLVIRVRSTPMAALNVCFQTWDPMAPFFVDSRRSLVRFTPQRLTMQFVSLLLVVAQGGPGSCAKLATGGGDPDARGDKAETMHPERMSGPLPRALLAALNARDDFPVVTLADASTRELAQAARSYQHYKDLYLTLYDVSLQSLQYGVGSIASAMSFLRCSCLQQGAASAQERSSTLETMMMTRTRGWSQSRRGCLCWRLTRARDRRRSLSRERRQHHCHRPQRLLPVMSPFHLAARLAP